MYEYIPSVRQTELCHYHELYYDAACTLGAYHPLLYEKLLVQRLNTGTQADLHRKGKVVLPGKEFLSTSNQEPGSEEVCYTVISHPPLRLPSLSSNDDGYENLDHASRRPGRSRGSQEMEYALLRTSTASPMVNTLEQDYKLVLPC
ncbi:germinal center-associated signaling and motility-like protein [Urocitellus parryii]